MNIINKAPGIGAVIGLLTGIAFYYLTPEIHWGFHLAIGLAFLLTGFSTGEKLAKREKIAAKDIGMVIGLFVGIAAGVATFYGIPGAHWGLSVIVGVVVGVGAVQADISQRAMERQAGDRQ